MDLGAFRVGKRAILPSPPPYPEYIGHGPLVGGLERDESDAVVERGMAEHARAEDGVFRDVTSGVNAGENVRQTLLDRFGVSIPYPSVHPAVLHHWKRGDRKEGRKEGRIKSSVNW